MPTKPAPGWKEVPNELLAAWRSVFDHAVVRMDLVENCPVCGVATLHQWFSLASPREVTMQGRRWKGSGSQWQWCSTCRSYEHSSAWVPDLWSDPLDVDGTTLMTDPGAIEAARTASAQRDRFTCPVCGYPGLFEPAWRGESPSDDICPSCGIQFGDHDAAGGDHAVRDVIHREWRQRWIDNGMHWASEGVRPPPVGWDPKAQLARLTR